MFSVFWGLKQIFKSTSKPRIKWQNNPSNSSHILEALNVTLWKHTFIFLIANILWVISAVNLVSENGVLLYFVTSQRLNKSEGLKRMVIVPIQCQPGAWNSTVGVSKHRSRLWQGELAPSHARLWQANVFLTVVYFSALCHERKKIWTLSKRGLHGCCKWRENVLVTLMGSQGIMSTTLTVYLALTAQERRAQAPLRWWERSCQQSANSPELLWKEIVGFMGLLRKKMGFSPSYLCISLCKAPLCHPF